MRIGDFCKTNLYTYSEKEKWSEIHYLDTGNVTRGKITEIQILIPGIDTIPSRARRKVQVNDIIYSTVRPNQRHYGIIKSHNPNMLVSTGFVVITVDQQIADPDFMYYFLTQDDVVETLEAIGEQSTSAYPSIKPVDIENLEIELPPLDEQKKISSVLKTIDDKISTNQKINDNLEQQVMALFRSWFVDYSPFGGTMPLDWNISSLGEATEMGAGGDKPKITSPTKTGECPFPIFSNGLSDCGLYGYTNEAKIYAESVTVSARGTIGFVCLRHVPYVPIVRLVTLIPKCELMSAKYLYLYLRQLNISGTGTTQQQLTVPDFRKTEIVIPNKDTMTVFTELITPIFEKMWANEGENDSLAKIRDTLLPKLMCGKIDVSAIKF